MQRIENLRPSDRYIPPTMDEHKEMASNGHTVLVIEDDEAIAAFIRLALESEGFRVILRFDGTEGIEAIDSGIEFNCLLTDIKMPGASGFEVIDRLRELRGGDFPVIIQSATADWEMDREIKKYKPFASLEKPFGLDLLLKTTAAGCEAYANRNNGQKTNEC